jgi:hypothetical protein
MWFSAVQCFSVRSNAVQCGSVRFNAYGFVRIHAVQCGSARFSAVQCGLVRFTVRFSVVHLDSPSEFPLKYFIRWAMSLVTTHMKEIFYLFGE